MASLSSVRLMFDFFPKKTRYDESCNAKSLILVLYFHYNIRCWHCTNLSIKKLFINREEVAGKGWRLESNLKQCISGDATIIDKAFETNSSFHVRQRNTGKVQFLFFRSFLLVLAKVSVWEEDWELGYNSMEFWEFPDFSKFPKFQNLRSFGSSWGNFYLPYLLLIMTLFSLVVNRKFCAMVSQYYDHDCLKNFLFFYVFINSSNCQRAVIFWLDFTLSF